MTLNATTSVTFKPLTDEEIDFYIETYQPLIKQEVMDRTNRNH